MDNKILIGAIAIITIIIMSGAVSAFDLFGNSDTDDNITLIKNETSGKAYISSYDNQPRYNYYLDGDFKNLPSNLEGYELKSTFYGENNSFIHTYDPDLKDVIEYPSSYHVAYFEAHKFYNITKIEVTIYNPDGEVVFNQTYDFDMNKIDLTGLDYTPTPISSDSSSGSISSSSDSGNANINYDIDADDNSAHYSVEGEIDGKSYNYDVNYNYN